MSTELERGDSFFFFFYRPRVGIEEVHSLQDVQRFFFVLRPDGDARLREVIVGTKRLPEVERDKHHHGHGRLAYALELPQEPGEAQGALGIEPQASYIVAVRNPDAPPLRAWRRRRAPPSCRWNRCAAAG